MCLTPEISAARRILTNLVTRFNRPSVFSPVRTLSRHVTTSQYSSSTVFFPPLPHSDMSRS